MQHLSLADWTVIIPLVFTGFGTLIGVWYAARLSYNNGKRTERIELLVDGRYGDVLQELADVKRLLASITKLPADQAKAEAAQGKADDQAKRVIAATIATPKVTDPINTPQPPIK
jgi:hypothetical protein